MSELEKQDKPQDKETENDKAVMMSAYYSAPLPPASQFEYYERVVNGAANRILTMAERQSRHRQCVEKWSVIGDQFSSFFGLLSALVITLFGFGGSFYLILNDKSIAGLSVIGTIIISLVGSFIYSSRQKIKELEKREQELKK